MPNIPVLQPSCSQEEIDAVSAVLRSSWWGSGKVCEQFEAALSKRTGLHAVTVNSCTAALHLALLDLGVGPGDEVIVPAITFVSTGLAALYCGATVVLADVRPETLTIDWDDALRRITKRTRVIIPVDYAGYPALYDGEAPLYELPQVSMVQDAAHSCGGTVYGDRVCYSFHPVKNLAAPNGGAILVPNLDSAERLRALRWCGIDRSTWQRSGKRYAWDYDIAEVGFKYDFDDVRAAIALVQLGRLDEMNARRRAIAARYSQNLSGLVGLPLDHPEHTWHLYVIRTPQRDRLADALAQAGISTGVHYAPLSRYPMFAGQARPVAESVWVDLLSLPMFYDLTDDQVDYICATIRVALGGGV